MYAKYDYTAFGTKYATGTTETVENRYTYTGRESTSDSSLMYYRYRMYAPRVGRFTARDPIGYVAGLNMYAYVGGSPLRWVDPEGLLRIELAFLGRGQDEYVPPPPRPVAEVDIPDWEPPEQSPPPTAPYFPTGAHYSGADVYETPSWGGMKTHDRVINGAVDDIVDKMDMDGDGDVDHDDGSMMDPPCEVDIRIAGYSWGAVNAIQVANSLNSDARILEDVYRAVRRVGLLDPVFTQRRRPRDLQDNTVASRTYYQTNGPGGLFPRRGVPIYGAQSVENIDVSSNRNDDGVQDPPYTPNEPIDHGSIQDPANGYVTKLLRWAFE